MGGIVSQGPTSPVPGTKDLRSLNTKSSSTRRGKINWRRPSKDKDPSFSTSSTSFVTVEKKPVVKLQRATSLNEEEVQEKNKQWLQLQSQSLAKTNTEDWEALFDSFCKEANREELSFDELNNLFIKFGTKVNRSMLRLLFTLFDANGNGVVDKHEFLVSVSFLTQATASTHNDDIIDMAYFLFDTNRGGTISKTEFNDMCLVLVNKARFVLGIAFLRSAFREHLQSQHCEENLDFFERVEAAMVQYSGFSKDAIMVRSGSFADFSTTSTSTTTFANKRGGGVLPKAMMPLQEARQIYEEFVADSASRQVNVSYGNQQFVEQALETHTQSDQKEIDGHVFDSCVNEVIGLMETDALPRFKEKIKSTLADRIWKEEELDEDGNMNKQEFRKWASKHPGMFSFLEELRHTLQSAVSKQKHVSATKIQRMVRRHQQQQHGQKL